MLCDSCGRESSRIFVRDVPDASWKYGFRNVFLCHRCIDVKREILETLQGEGCLNSMEICRRLNGVGLWSDYPDAKEHPEVCYNGRKFSYQTRPERCNYKENGCVFWSLTVYNILRKMEQKGLIKSKRTIHYDNRKGRGLRQDVFRFWFIDEKAYLDRIEKQKLTAYMLRD
jgi:hypothetical protein